MSTVPVYADPQIYGVNGEYFHRIICMMLEELPGTFSCLRQDATELEENIRAMIGPFERLAFLTRLAARDHLPYAPRIIEDLRRRLADIQKIYIDDSQFDFINPELKSRLEIAAGWLAQAICILAIENHPDMATINGD